MSNTNDDFLNNLCNTISVDTREFQNEYNDSVIADIINKMKKVEDNNIQDIIFATEEELKNIREMNSDFSKAKMNLGDLELQKQSLIKYIDSIKDVFSKHEKILMEKYGEDAVINIETGEITKKQ